jgi:hypothetical protein
MSNLMPRGLEALSRAHDAEHELEVARRAAERESGEAEVRRDSLAERVVRAVTRRGRKVDHKP